MKKCLWTADLLELRPGVKKKENGNWVPELKGEEKKMIKDGGSGYLAGHEREERKVIETESRRSVKFIILDESKSLKSN